MDDMRNDLENAGAECDLNLWKSTIPFACGLGWDGVWLLRLRGLQMVRTLFCACLQNDEKAFTNWNVFNVLAKHQ